MVSAATSSGCGIRSTSTSGSDPALTLRVAITAGDPRGIGPEIVAKVLADPPAGVELVPIGMPGGTATTAVAAGREVGRQIEDAVRRALAGEVRAIVTGPAEKKALHAAGIHYPGHTEWLAALSGVDETVMMLVADRLRVALVTTHVALRDALDMLSTDRIVRVGGMTRTALIERFGISAPRLAVCAVNPHAGEGGAFGREDDEILAPAARALDAVGPLPADTVFVRALRGEFDAVLAPYHDVGMTAVKVAGFGRGVNVTLGLPFVRTAPDHGTAMDIAGQGTADPGSMREAVRLAAALAAPPAPS